MKSPRLRRPSPALVVACCALVFSMAGTGYAAAKINGKNIKKGTVSGTALKKGTITGSKVKKNTLTGTQINESKLGKVLSAATADNANSLAGAPATDFARTGNFVRVFKTMNIGDADATLVTAGDISVKMQCVNESGTDYLRIYAATSADGALLESENDSQDPLLTSTTPDSSEISNGISGAGGTAHDSNGYDDTGFVMNAASTHLITLLEGASTKILNRSGHGCIYGGTFIVE